MRVSVTIGATTIGQAEVSNETGGTQADDVNTYAWTFVGEAGRKLDDTVEHRYGDGAMRLAHKVMAAIAQRYEIAGLYGRRICRHGFSTAANAPDPCNMCDRTAAE